MSESTTRSETVAETDDRTAVANRLADRTDAVDGRVFKDEPEILTLDYAAEKPQSLPLGSGRIAQIDTAGYEIAFVAVANPDALDTPVLRVYVIPQSMVTYATPDADSTLHDIGTALRNTTDACGYIRSDDEILRDDYLSLKFDVDLDAVALSNTDRQRIVASGYEISKIAYDKTESEARVYIEEHTDTGHARDLMR